MEILLFFLVFLLILWLCYYFLKAGKSSETTFSTSVVIPQTSKEGQRKHPRTNVNWPVVIETSEGTVEAEVKNISIGGAFICCERPMAVGEVFRLTITAPDHEPIEATAKAVWSNAHLPKEKVIHLGMGVQFLNMSEKHIQFVRSLFNESPSSKKIEKQGPSPPSSV